MAIAVSPLLVMAPDVPRRTHVTPEEEKSYHARAGMSMTEP
jgi:hypothetical protein